MAFSPVADNVKVRLDPADPHGFSGGDSTSKETGILVEVPTQMRWVGFHSFAFEKSFGALMDLDDMLKEVYRPMIGKRVMWESYQESGRRFKEGDDEYVLIKLTDIIAVGEPEDKATTVTDVRRAGGFKV